MAALNPVLVAGYVERLGHSVEAGGRGYSKPTTGILQSAEVKISINGRGRWLDNVFVERLWRSVKYEEVSLKDYGALPEARAELAAYFRFDNEERLHQELDYQTPAPVWQALHSTPTGSAPVLTASTAS